VPDALRAAGVEIRVHDELFPQGTQDVVWLAEAGANRWVVITRDDRIRYNQLEKQAVLAAKLRFFSLTSSSLTGDEAGALLVSALGRISRQCRRYSKGGFIAKISRGLPETAGSALWGASCPRQGSFLPPNVPLHNSNLLPA
jgi:hypothetical protein